MKKTINGRVYDTESSIELLSKDNGYEKNDYRYRVYILYKKKKSPFYFLYIRSNSARGRGYITPLSEEEALNFLRRKP